MDQQNWDRQFDPDGRIRHIAAFLPVAWAGVASMLTRSECKVESFGVEGDGDVVHATTIVDYEGCRWRFRRQVWPSSHPAKLTAQLYTTSLEERLNTRPGVRPAEGEIGDMR